MTWLLNTIKISHKIIIIGLFQLHQFYKSKVQLKQLHCKLKSYQAQANKANICVRHVCQRLSFYTYAYPPPHKRVA